MAAEEKGEEMELLEVPPAPLPQPQFLEVACKSSDKIRRFAAGTEAGYALYIINWKREFGVSPALHIEAVKEGEEPVCFGPNAVLVNYGQGWKLQTVVEEDYEVAKRMKQTSKPFPNATKSAVFHREGKHISKPSSNISFLYIGKILAVFAFMILLAGILTLFLENLPSLILYITSSTVES